MLKLIRIYWCIGSKNSFKYKDYMTRIIILAAGNGTRMSSDQPKVLVPLSGRPMIKYLLESILASGVDSNPIIVVSPANQDIIKKELDDFPLNYVVQAQQLGTGNAVASAMDSLGEDVNRVLVLYGDHPFLKAESIIKIASSNPQPLAMMTTELPDFDDWRHNFYHWGRIIRDENKRIVKIAEFKDASPEEIVVTEVNPAVMCFDRDWLAQHLSNIDNHNNSKEYYLTDLVKIAFNEEREILSIGIEPHEAMGINSKDELEIAERLLTAQ